MSLKAEPKVTWQFAPDSLVELLVLLDHFLRSRDHGNNLSHRSCDLRTASLQAVRPTCKGDSALLVWLGGGAA